MERRKGTKCFPATIPNLKAWGNIKLNGKYIEKLSKKEESDPKYVPSKV